MDSLTLFTLFLALVWGIVWAALLQLTYPGRWLAARRTWLSVAIGIGVDLLIILLVAPLDVWLPIVGIIAASSIGIVARSLRNEWRDSQELIKARHDTTDTTGK